MRNTPLKAFAKKSPIEKDSKKTFAQIQKMKSKAKDWLKKQKIKKVVRGSNVLGIMLGTSTTAQATQPGTGTHGGKRVTKYNPKSGKYE